MDDIFNNRIEVNRESLWGFRLLGYSLQVARYNVEIEITLMARDVSILMTL